MMLRIGELRVGGYQQIVGVERMWGRHHDLQFLTNSRGVRCQR
jgi:hypothetical protein